MKIVIIEDEIAAQQSLEQTIKKNYPQFTIAAITDSVPHSIELITNIQPDIVFIDIEIKMGSGFDVLAGLSDIQFEIIFTTAFNQFAIEAFKFHAIDYLLKPIEEKQLLHSINHCIKRLEEKNSAQQISNLLEYLRHPVQPKKCLNVSNTGGVEFIDLQDILYVSAKGSYTQLSLKNKTTIVISKSIKEIEKSLMNSTFYRIHNSYIINSNYLSKYHKGRGGDVVLIDGTSLPVSVNRKEEFLKHFGIE